MSMHIESFSCQLLATREQGIALFGKFRGLQATPAATTAFFLGLRVSQDKATTDRVAHEFLEAVGDVATELTHVISCDSDVVNFVTTEVLNVTVRRVNGGYNLQIAVDGCERLAGEVLQAVADINSELAVVVGKETLTAGALRLRAA